VAAFDYHEAFGRNLGWLTPGEQETLRGKKIAIAGLGGAGGVHLLTLARLGIGRFHIADLDQFDLVNFNRQAGASMSSIGQPKAQQTENVDAFLDGVDLYVDGLDYFVFSARRMVYDACRARGIPITFAVPLGMGAAVLNFMPDGPSFDDYFRLQGTPEDEWPTRFLVALAPALLHRGYLVYPEIVDFKTQRVPSTGLACQLCAGMAGTEALKILLGRGKVRAVPHSLQFDAYTGKLKHTWRPGGNAHPLQRLAIAYVNWRLSRAHP